MTQRNTAPNSEMPLSDTPDETHKFSRKTMLKDREDSLRANLLKRKQQKQTKQQIDETKS
jgi:hypothetical protein